MTGQTDNDDSLRAAMRMFHERLVEDERRLKQAMKDFQAGTADAVHRIFRIAHGLAGAAGIFGHDELGLRARALAQCIDLTHGACCDELLPLSEHLLDGLLSSARARHDA